MASYRVYYCDAHSKMFSAVDFEAVDDVGAVECAGSLVTGRALIFELWQRSRLVYRSPRCARSHPGRPAAARPDRAGLRGFASKLSSPVLRRPDR
jgi:hypothetical protein